jgi:hypothetical protein
LEKIDRSPFVFIFWKIVLAVFGWKLAANQLDGYGFTKKCVNQQSMWQQYNSLIMKKVLI